jgi:hypothetical protein
MNTNFRLSLLFFHDDSDLCYLHCEDVESDTDGTRRLRLQRRSRVAECSCIFRRWSTRTTSRTVGDSSRSEPIGAVNSEAYQAALFKVIGCINIE